MKHLKCLKAFLYADITAMLVLITVLLLSLKYSYLENHQVFIHLSVIILAIFLGLSSLYFYQRLMVFISQDQLLNKSDRTQFEESQKLIHVLKSQRHDFRNQLQVIKVLAQLNKTAEIVQYIQDCDIALDFTGAIAARIDNPIISAMLLIFSAQAKEKGISFNVDSDLNFNEFSLPPVRITSILGNIIQNAIEALEKDERPERSIQVTIWETEDSYYFLIWNNGPVILKNFWEKIFAAGFSTKNSTGLGLSIVKELVAELDGKITVTSTQEMGTEFKIAIPKQQGLGESHKTAN
jgi:sensor histidine kinase regulating citrate/malate metabolism